MATVNMIRSEWGGGANGDVAGLSGIDPARAAATRRAFVERYADTGTLVIGTHFPAPTAGLLQRGGDGDVRFVADGAR